MILSARAGDSATSLTLSVRILRASNITWLILRGEADLATRDHLRAELERVDLGASGAVHLHVADLAFADVATVRELATFAHATRQAGHLVRTCGSGRTLRTVARIMNVEDDLGMTWSRSGTSRPMTNAG